MKTNPNSSWLDIKNALGVDGAQVSRTIDVLIRDNIIEKVDNRYNSLLWLPHQQGQLSQLIDRLDRIDGVLLFFTWVNPLHNYSYKEAQH